MRVTVFERDASAIRGEGKYRGPIQIQSNALAALQAVDADIAARVMAEGCITARARDATRAPCILPARRARRAHGVPVRRGAPVRRPHAARLAPWRPVCACPWSPDSARVRCVCALPRACAQGDRINGLVDGVTGDWYCKFDTFHPAVDNGLPVTRVISRVTLQSILSSGLPESAILNNCKVESFEDGADCVTAVLEDGRRISGDVLIGADGACAAAGEATRARFLAERAHRAAPRRRHLVQGAHAAPGQVRAGVQQLHGAARGAAARARRSRPKPSPRGRRISWRGTLGARA